MIVLDLGKVQKLSGFRYLPRQDRENGRIKDYEVYASPKPFKPRQVRSSELLSFSRAAPSRLRGAALLRPDVRKNSPPLFPDKSCAGLKIRINFSFPLFSAVVRAGIPCAKKGGSTV